MHYFVSSNITSSTGNALNLGASDDVYLAPNVDIVSTGNSYSGISSVNSVSAEIAGIVYGYYSIAFTGGSYTSYIFVDASGTVATQTGGTGVSVYSPHQIVNRGQISADGAGSYGIYTNNAGAIANTGSITGTIAIVDYDTTSGDTTYLLNTGTIIGTSQAISCALGTEAEYIANQGTMFGGISLGSHAGTTLVNSGMVDTSNGTPTIFIGSGMNDFLVNTGTIQATVNDAAGPINLVSTGNGNQDVIRNEGVVYFGGRNGASNAVLLGSGIGDGLENDAGAKITGNVTFGGGNYGFLVNVGTIEGNVNLGAGSGMTYNGGGSTGGTIASGYAINCGSGGDVVYGGASVATINGGAGSDTIVAAAGGSRVTGGGGSDQLYTNVGADVFAYTNVTDSNASQGVDLIHGFRTGVDRVDLSAFHISSIAAVGIYSSGSSTALLANVSGGQLAVYFNTANALQASDLLF